MVIFFRTFNLQLGLGQENAAFYAHGSEKTFGKTSLKMVLIPKAVLAKDNIFL